ncbi:MAG: class I SAM-dependent methyltransferase [Thaumarchaeota archaeon]|nr:class I SAM-dependent methyltransferase [Nitrososphaerota archaeon]
MPRKAHERMETDEFAERLMSKERREWQDPEQIIERIGIRRGMVVADLACGPGFFTIPIAEKVGKEGEVYAVDSDKGMLDHLRANLKKSRVAPMVVKAITADVSDTGIPYRSVDVALFANILHDLDDLVAFMREVKRIGKDDSIMVDIDWQKTHTEHGPPFEIRLTKEESTRILSRNGLKVTRTIDAGPFHYGLICKRLLHSGR